ncbi:DUF3606 domain-containing protein [Pedobacter cryoconitis]|uniref:DUF3606 domain-containing protein n=1 Tax=Pedobacter cryoconitis TaxID=188932 RepID=A0A7X0J005_9SPHI|nr:DUF3606 domain-containing protein [Pedobacter cryoconitis]MBB6498580.1 hypothetical protein [Pedobacter cryoconitis]
MLRHTYHDENEMKMPESKTINLQEYYEVEYWSGKFGITPELLQRMVKESNSTIAEEVKNYIKIKYPL